MPKPPRRSRSWLGLAVALALALGATVGLAQTGPGPSPLLAPPTLPSVLPGGAPLPSLPPGVQQDAKLRLKGHGLPSGPIGHRGDILLKIAVQVPKSLTPEQEELVKSLATVSL